MSACLSPSLSHEKTTVVQSQLKAWKKIKMTSRGPCRDTYMHTSLNAKLANCTLEWVSIGSIYLCTPWEHKKLNILLNFNPLSFAQMSSLPNTIYRHSPSFYNVWSKQSHLYIKMSNASTLSIHEHGWSNQHKTISQKSRYQPNTHTRLTVLRYQPNIKAKPLLDMSATWLCATCHSSQVIWQ